MPQPSRPRSPMGWLMDQTAPARLPLGLTIGAGAGQGPLIVLQALVIAWIADAVVMGGLGPGELMAPLLALPIILAARAGLAWGQEKAAFTTSSRLRATLRHSLTTRLMRLGPAWAAHGESGGRVTLLLDQVEALDGFYARFLPQMALALLVPALLLAAVFAVDWLAGLILLMTLPLIPVFMVLVGWGAQAAQARHLTALERLGAHFLDRLRGLETLHLLGRAAAEVEQVRRAAEAYRHRVMAVLRIAFLSSAVLEFFASVAIAMVAVYVGLSLLGQFPLTLRAEPVTLFSGLFVLLLAPEVFAPLRQLAAAYHDRAAALAVAERVQALPPEATTAPVTLPDWSGLLLDRVRVRYPGAAAPVLDNFSLRVEPGQWLGLNGPSGVGKTTVLRVLLGFLEVERGVVSCPARVGWVGQNTHLFHGTVAENVRLGWPDASDAEVLRALERAGLAGVVAALPKGLDTPLGEGGFGLSGGQAQRLAVARAWLVDAPVLLLDEPTASLDPHTANRLLDALAELAQGRAVLMVSHDPRTLARTDRVITLTGRGLADG